MNRVDRSTDHEVGINEIVERLKKDAEQTEANEDAGQRRNDPVNRFRISRPTKPEDTNSECDTSNDDLRQPPFRNGHVVVRRQLFLIRRLPDEDEKAC